MLTCSAFVQGLWTFTSKVQRII